MKILSFAPNLGHSYIFYLMGVTPEIDAGVIKYRETDSEYKLTVKVTETEDVLIRLLDLKKMDQEINDANIILEINDVVFSMNLKVSTGKIFDPSKTLADYYSAFYENVILIKKKMAKEEESNVWQARKPKEEEKAPLIVNPDDFANELEVDLLLSTKTPLLIQNLEQFWNIQLYSLNNYGIRSIELPENVTQKIFQILDEGISRFINFKVIINSIFKIIINANISTSEESVSIKDNVLISLLKDIVHTELESRDNLVKILG